MSYIRNKNGYIFLVNSYRDVNGSVQQRQTSLGKSEMVVVKQDILREKLFTYAWSLPNYLKPAIKETTWAWRQDHNADSVLKKSIKLSTKLHELIADIVNKAGWVTTQEVDKEKLYQLLFLAQDIDDITPSDEDTNEVIDNFINQVLQLIGLTDKEYKKIREYSWNPKKRIRQEKKTKIS